MSKTLENITDLIAATLNKEGYDLVRAQVKGGGKYANLQIMAERQDQAPMRVEDCTKLSFLLTEQLEELGDRYDLEVSSPGIDRPLMALKDYVRFQGHMAKVELKAALEGQKRFEGKIKKVADKTIELSTEKGSVSLPFGAIESAKLLLTEALLAAGQAKH